MPDQTGFDMHQERLAQQTHQANREIVLRDALRALRGERIIDLNGTYVDVLRALQVAVQDELDTLMAQGA